MSNRNFRVSPGSRNADPAWKVNRDKDFHDKYGNLEEGYNTTGGEGMVAVGMTTVTGTVGAGKDGMRGYAEDKVVFGPAPTQQESAPSEPEPDLPETKEPFEPVGKSDDHKTAEENYDQHFENGNPWDTTSAVDSYQSAFDRAVSAGQDLTAGDYLRQRTDDKKGGVNRFTHYLTDHNTLASHESHRASMNGIKKAEYEGLNPPALIDPGNSYDKYKKDIDSIGD